jgi:ribosomal protein S18 acetylase RimI-like enzyme
MGGLWERTAVDLGIRTATIGDEVRLADFNIRLARESEAKHLDADRVRAGVEAVLSTPAYGRYYVAECDGEIVGQLLTTYEWSDWRNGMFWWIQSVYVAPQHRRRGVFSALYEHVVGLARQDGGVCGVRLYVDESNGAGLSTYESLGLVSTAYRVMEREL